LFLPTGFTCIVSFRLHLCGGSVPGMTTGRPPAGSGTLAAWQLWCSWCGCPLVKCNCCHLLVLPRTTICAHSVDGLMFFCDLYAYSNVFIARLCLFLRFLGYWHVCVFTCRLNRCTTNICDCDEKFALHLTCDGGGK